MSPTGLPGGPMLPSLALLVSAGCGVHYWQRHGADVQDVQQDSRARLGLEPEQVYRACMRGHGWQRLQAGVPERNQFRGPEDVSDFDNPPPPTEGQGATHTEAATEIACRGPRVSRPAGVVCPHR